MGLLSNKYKLVDCASIQVKREDRQRREVNTDDLDDSILARGVYVPIIVEEIGGILSLIAGERRLTSCIKQGIRQIPVRFAGDLSETERQIIELEENVKRRELHWRDEVRAVARIHFLYSEGQIEWSQADTARSIGQHASIISQSLRVFADIENGKIKDCTGMRQAYNVLSRGDDRAAENLLSDIMNDTHGLVAAPAPAASDQKPQSHNAAQETFPEGAELQREATTQNTIVAPAPPSGILHKDFSEWAQSYTGQKFNFVHCDFPYGVNVFDGQQANTTGSQRGYSDDPDVYWKLIEVFCANLDNFMAHSAHLLFWFPMEYYTETLKVFQELAPSLEFNPYPLYWTKTDNMGILPDSERGPRRIVETALMASREDRKIAKACSNWYGSQTDKRYHPSTKPQPMLEHFFKMFVDESTRILDPTCGSGSAIRAAEALGAEFVLGLERDEDHYIVASNALKTWRGLNRLSKVIPHG